MLLDECLLLVKQIRIDKLADQLSTLVEIVSKKIVTPAPVKAIEETYVTCGGAHYLYNFPATDNNQASVCATTETEETTDKEQTNFQGSATQIPPPVIPISILEPDVLKSFPKTTPIPKSDIQRSLPKPNIPFPLRRDDQKSRDKASNQMGIFQIFQRFALRHNKDTVERELLQRSPSKASLKSEEIPASFLYHMDLKQSKVTEAKSSIEEPPELELKDLPSHLEYAFLEENDKLPVIIAKEKTMDDFLVFGDSFDSCLSNLEKMLKRCEDMNLVLNWEKCHFMCREGIVLGHKILKSGNEVDRAKVDVIAKLPHPTTIKVVPDWKLTFRTHVDASDFAIGADLGQLKRKALFSIYIMLANMAAKHPQKHANESIKMVDDTCKNSVEETNNLSSDFHASKSPLEKFTDEPAPVCSTLPEKDNNEEEIQEAKIIEEPTAKRRTRFIECLKNFKLEDSLIMGDEHLSTFRVEEIVPIPRESEDTFDNNKGCDSLFVSKDDLKKDVQEENFQIYSNPLFEFNDNFNYSNVNPLFNEMEEDVKNKNSNVSNSDEPVLLHTSFPDKVECFDPGDDIDEIDAFLAMEVSTNIEEGYYDSEGDVIFLENLLSDDTTHNLSPEVFFDHEPQNETDHNTLITFSPKSDPLHHEFAGELITLPPRIVREHKEYLNHMMLLCGDAIVRNNLLNDDISLPEYECFTFDVEPDTAMINNFDELNEDECFDPGGDEINVEVNDSFTFVTQTFLPYLTYPEVSPLLSSTKNEDTIFDPGIST
ncbi:hypothetical protein Tco_0940086 [Tanacetum coccineum]|uniref:Reverse transcriptase domain-containing protein n=1 Tax=Tanacetum coccineum TaxID=301880 RepID=A0ABQ5DLZ1_9ASTR